MEESNQESHLSVKGKQVIGRSKFSPSNGSLDAIPNAVDTIVVDQLHTVGCPVQQMMIILTSYSRALKVQVNLRAPYLSFYNVRQPIWKAFRTLQVSLQIRHILPSVANLLKSDHLERRKTKRN
jgi:hypothetical protein